MVRTRLAEAEQLARYRWAAELVAGGRVLDVGCGIGTGSTVLAAGGASEVVGVDRATTLVEIAAGATRPGLRFEQGELERLAHPDDGFDVVVCFHALQHAPDPRALADELARVLAPDGIVAVSVPADTELEPLLARWPQVRVLHQRDWIGSSVAAETDLTDPFAVLGLEHAPASAAVGLASEVELPPSPPALAVTDGDLALTRVLEHVTRQEHDAERHATDAAVLATLQRERRELRERLVDAETDAGRVLHLEAELHEAWLREEDLKRRLGTANQIIEDIVSSPSWRVTKPLRALKDRLASRRP